MSDEYEDELEQEQEEQPTQALIPVEQETILFYGKPIVVVRLPDGRVGVVLRWICENLHLLPQGQIARIKRTEVIAHDLVYASVQSSSGVQNMATLVLRAAPYWLATIDTRRMKKDDPQRLEILRYQGEVVDVLYAWASSPRTIEPPKNLVPAEPITQPTRPSQDAPLAEWHDYYQRMAALIEWQMDVEQWRGSIESRVEGIEALIPDIFDRLPPVTITPEHQRQVQTFVRQLAELTGKHPNTIYDNLKTAFSVPRYQDLPEGEWEQVEKWFTGQIDRAKARKKKP